MHTATETSIKSFILNKTVTAVDFYLIKEKYYVFDEEHTWVIDAGAEISFGDEKFSFGWNAAAEIYQHHFGAITELYDEIEIANLDEQDVSGLKNLAGNKITDVKFQWTWYSGLDENFEPLETKNYIPVEMLLTFENGSILQLAAINYAIDFPTKSLKDITFDSEGSFLVTLDDVLEISDESAYGDDVEETV